MKKAMVFTAACVAALTLSLNHSTHAQTIVFSGTDGTLDIDAASGPVLQSGLTLTLSANTGTVNATAAGLGINGPSLGDDTDGLDTLNAIEVLTLSFDKEITFDSITLANVGENDALDVSIAGGGPVSIAMSGQFVFSAPKTALAGELVTLTATEQLAALTATEPNSEYANSEYANNGVNITQFIVTVIPEPSSLSLLLGASGALVFLRRRRRQG